MYNKIIKLSGVVLFYCSCVTLVTGSNTNTLKILRNVNGTIMEVPSKLEIPSGANLTLICKIDNIASKELLDGYITWFIPLKIHSELKLQIFKIGSNLVLSNVKANNDGLYYVCGSLKYKTFLALHLIVKHNKFAKSDYLNFPISLTKREVVPENELYGGFTELIKNLTKMREDLLRSMNDRAKIPEYGFNFNNIVYNNLNNRENSLKNINNRDKSIEYGFNNNDRRYNIVNDHGNSNAYPFPIRTIVIIFGVLFVIINVYLAIRFCAIYMEKFQTHHMGNPNLQLDLPPAYPSSTHNSTQNLNAETDEFNKEIANVAENNNSDLPPSYDEAMGHKGESYNDIANANHSTTHDSGPSPKGYYSDKDHNADGGFSGDHNSEGGSDHRIWVRR